MDTGYIANKIVETQPSENAQAVEAARIGILDYMASSLLAQNEPELEQVRKVYGHGDARDAALLNGVRAHLLDLDDAHSEVRGHPSAVVLSALFAAADPDTSGKAFLDAYIIGTEVMARLGESVNNEHYLRGWHSTGTLGAVGAAAAVARLYGYNERQTANAIGIGATLGSGLRAQFGTTVKAVHVGIAAQHGVEAALLTQAGVHGDPNVLFKRFGFMDVMGFKDAERTQESRQEIYGKAWEKEWGSSWRIASPGLWLKRYPFCSAAMAGCDAAEALRARHAYTREEIRDVAIGFFSGKDSALYARAPQTGEQGRFSIEYIVWLNLLGIDCSLERFSPTALTEEMQEDLTRLHRVSLGPLIERPYTQVTVTRTDGTQDTEQVIDPLGSPGNPLGLADEERKLAWAVTDEETRTRLVNTVKDLERGTIRPLWEIMRQDPA